MQDHPTLHAALAAVQRDLPAVTTDQTAKVETRGGGSYSYSYASLADINKAVLPKLAEHGLTWACIPIIDDDPRLLGILTHGPTGEQLPEARWALPRTNDPQALGSAITYGRRYLLTAVVGVAPDSDDDGATARRAAREEQPRPRRTQPTPAPREEDPERAELRERFRVAYKELTFHDTDAATAAYQRFSAGLDSPADAPLPVLRARVEQLEASAAEVVAAAEDGNLVPADADAAAHLTDWYDQLTVEQVATLIAARQVEVPVDGEDPVALELLPGPLGLELIERLEAARESGARKGVKAALDTAWQDEVPAE